MLENFQVNNYKINTYQELNDTINLIDYKDRKYGYNTITVNPDLAYKHQGSFFTLLNELGVSSKDYVYVLHLNGFVSPVEYDGILTTLKVLN